MKAIEEQKEDKVRFTCPKCKAFVLEVSPFLSKSQRIITHCRKCKIHIEIN